MMALITEIICAFYIDKNHNMQQIIANQITNKRKVFHKIICYRILYKQEKYLKQLYVL